MKRSELWELLKESKPPDSDAAMKLVCSKMKIMESTDILTKIRSKINYFKLHVESKKQPKGII